MEKNNYSKELLLENIEGFTNGQIKKGLYFYLSNEVLEWSNCPSAKEYVEIVLNYFIRKKLRYNHIDIDIFNDVVVVIAHGKSTKQEWIVFGNKDDKKGIKIEQLLEKIPKNMLIVLYICNDGNYTLNLDNLKIIYPTSGTGTDNLKFKISNCLLEAIKKNL